MGLVNNQIIPEFKFIILIDFTRSSYKALDYLIKLVKTVGGSIEIFSVIEPSDIIRSENQIVALKSIQAKKILNNIKLDSIVEMIESEGISVKYSHTIGSFDSELKDILNCFSSDIVVIDRSGKNVLGKTAKYVLNNYNGNLLIIHEFSKFNSGDSIVAVPDGNTLDLMPLNFPSIYSRLTKLPIVSLRNEMIKGELSVDAKSNKIELYCLKKKGAKKSFLNRLLVSRNNTIDLIEKTEVPIFILAQD